MVAYFNQYTNSDSLLQTTLFFPDSIFQVNSRYDSTHKALVRSYLTLLQSAQRQAFFRLKELNYAQVIVGSGNTANLLDFEKYWPFEVRYLDQWLRNLERKYRMFSPKAKAELLTLRLQQQFDSLRNSENTNYQERNKTLLLEKIETANKTIETVQTDYRQLKYIGWTALGLVMLLGYYFWNKSDQLLKSKNQSLLEEKKKSEDLLMNMLPTEIVRQIKSRNPVRAREYDDVAVLFTDFKGFSTIADNESPEVLVTELNNCFTAFDRIIEKYRLQKIKTIGDAYMCVSGLYTRGGNHVQRMVFAALEIQQFLNKRKIERDAAGKFAFQARIGIHVGNVVAGVVGTNKIAFDVWGNTVNVAQQMELYGEVGRVNISGETYALIQNVFACTPREKITAKNKKKYEMYFVKGKIRE
ncbi:MAG: adenylate/guanylate cyclase domain-containing protein [Bacteroidota bacterium]